MCFLELQSTSQTFYRNVHGGTLTLIPSKLTKWKNLVTSVRCLIMKKIKKYITKSGCSWTRARPAILFARKNICFRKKYWRYNERTEEFYPRRSKCTVATFVCGKRESYFLNSCFYFLSPFVNPRRLAITIGIGSSMLCRTACLYKLHPPCNYSSVLGWAKKITISLKLRGNSRRLSALTSQCSNIFTNRCDRLSRAVWHVLWTKKSICC